MSDPDISTFKCIDVVGLYALPLLDVKVEPHVKLCTFTKLSAFKFVNELPSPANTPSTNVIPLPVTLIDPVNL